MKLAPFLGVYFIIGLVLEIGAILLFRVVTNYFYYGGGGRSFTSFLQLYISLAFILYSKMISRCFLKWGFGYCCAFDINYLRTWCARCLRNWILYTLVWGLPCAKKFPGRVVVYFNEQNGEAPAQVGDTLVFNVQTDGSVHTSHRFKKYRMVRNKLPRSILWMKMVKYTY